MSIVLPFKFEIQHAQPGNWINSTDENNLLRMAGDIEKEIINESGVPGVKDHAIPSPVAHIMDFRKRLMDQDHKTLLAWKGILAALALKDNYGLNIEMKFKELKTTLGEVILEGLVESCKWPEDIELIPVFYKDNIPFAFAVPEISICPFKEYPKTLFAGLEWYDEASATWHDPVLQIRTEEAERRGALTVQGKKLFYWLQALDQKIPLDNKYKHIYESFTSSAQCGVELTEEDEAKYSKTSETGLYNRGDLDEYKSRVLEILVAEKLVETAAPPQGALQVNEVFSDNLLIYVPADITVDESDKEYMPFSYLLNVLKYSSSEKKAFITPPLSKKMLDTLNQSNNTIKINAISYPEDECLNLIDHKKNVQNLHLTCTIELEFLNEGQTIKYKWKYNNTKIVWTNAMPYMLLWPNVNLPPDKWRSYYLAVATHNRRPADNLLDTEFLWKDERFYRVDKLNVTAVARNAESKTFNVSSKYNPIKIGTQIEYQMLHSETIFDAIGLSYKHGTESFELGYLMIDHTKGNTYKEGDSDRLIFNETYNVGIDFGTTSTNIHIKQQSAGSDSDLGTPRSISSPGKFLLELTRTDEKLDRIDKESYFFMHRKDALGKIFTAGQLFRATLSEDEEREISNISGKFIEIDREDFWEQLGDESNFSVLDIYIRLKFPDRDAEQGNSIRASKLFIQSLLQTALLECRISGADRVNIHYSYPFKSGNYPFGIWENVVETVAKDFANNVNVVTSHKMTESEAAGVFYTNRSRSLSTTPILRRGYAIIDIGGGTSDVSLWKRPSDDEEQSQLRAQHSFKYAGQQLVNRTIIQTFRSEADLKRAVKIGDNSKMKNITEAYKVVREIEPPIGSRWTPPLIKANSILDIILENNCFNAHYMQTIDDFRVFVKLKFMSLFYLIARFMNEHKSKELYDNEAKTFTIHLAGCGAKGLKFCTGNNDLSSFDESSFGQAVVKMIRSILELQEDYIIKINAPLTDNKEEVVSGLVMAEVRPDRAQPDEGKTDIIDLRKEGFDLNLSMEAFNNLIDTLKTFSAGELDYKGNKSVSVLDFFDLHRNKVNLHEDFRSLFDGIVTALEVSNPNKATVYDYFSMYMLDMLIDKFLAKPQRYIN